MQSVNKPIPSFERSYFWIKVRKTEGCWLWTGAITKNGLGYGDLKLDGLHYAAHRVSYAIHFFDPLDKFVLHTCDNRLCVKPKHLFLGTHEANVVDMVSKNRNARGTKHGSCYLTEEQIYLIRQSTESSRVTAMKFGTSPANVRSIKLGYTWNHLS